jgi:NitT/TauT family transport system ATP-binding protein
MTMQLGHGELKLDTPALSVRGLHKQYDTGADTKLVLADVSFDVLAGETVCIVGPSGAGKTTLLRCLAGLMPATSGEVFLEEVAVVEPPDHLAVVFQDYSRSLMPWMSVLANVELPLRSRGVDKATRRAKAQAALTSVGLGNALNLHPWQLSGGMQQRVAIARAVAYEPSVLVMDEPFASVDAQTRADLEDLTHALKQKYGMTIVLVTHDIEESVYLADRVVVLSGAPTCVTADVRVDLPYPRDQVTTKSTRRFAELRAQIVELVRRPSGAVH